MLPFSAIRLTTRRCRAGRRDGQRAAWAAAADLVRIDRERGIAELRHGGNGFRQPAARRTSMDRHRTSVLPHGGVAGSAGVRAALCAG